MEGGSDLDLLCLERPWTDRGEEQRDNKDKEDPPSFLTMEHTDESKKLTEQAKEYGRQRQLKEVSQWLCSFNESCIYRVVGVCLGLSLLNRKISDIKLAR